MMKCKLGVIVCLILMLTAHRGYSQFWFGPKVGGFRTYHNYFDDKREDDWKAKDTNGFVVGAVMNYKAKRNFSVQTELQYELIRNNVVNAREDSSFQVNSKSNIGFLSIPILMRYQKRLTPDIHVYFNLGPKVSILLAGSTTAFYNDLEEHFDGAESISYRWRFGERLRDENLDSPDTPDDGKFPVIINQPKRLKYGLDFGFGVYWDIVNKDRIAFDFRYSYGHSFMGFNEGSDLSPLEFIEQGPSVFYDEDLEYRVNLLTVSVSYLFGYNPHDALKGSSTLQQKDSKSKKKKK